MNNTRRKFLKVTLAISGAALLGAGCGDDDAVADSGASPDSGGGSDSGPPADCSTVTASIGTNHGHELMLIEADVTGGAQMTYDITGTGSHAHSVSISAADFGRLAAGETITLVSGEGNSHTHDITIMCG